jgi:adenylate cyclase
MMRPFKPGDKLKDHAVPISDVLQQLQTQLAEFQALKESLEVGAAGITGGPQPQYSSLATHHSEGMDSGIATPSSSFLHLPGDTTRNSDMTHRSQ